MWLEDDGILGADLCIEHEFVAFPAEAYEVELLVLDRTAIVDGNIFEGLEFLCVHQISDVTPCVVVQDEAR